jgi:hypothetical protein
VPQLWISPRPLVNMMKDLFKAKQIHKLDQAQKPAKRAKSLRTGTVRGGSRDSTGSTVSLSETFTKAIFRGTLKCLINHLGYLLCAGIGFAKLNPNRKTRWFSIFYSNLGTRSRQ